MQSKIEGTTLPVLSIRLDPGERLFAETGELSWKTPNISLRTTTSGAGNSGFFGAISRAIAGGGLFMTEFFSEGGSGMVSFAAKIPGQIVEHNVDSTTSYMVHRHGYMASTDGVNLDLGFQRKLGAGIFGGDGFRLQRISGYGKFWTMLGGEIIPVDLGPGEQLDVHPGHVGMFEERVNFDITMLPGIRNKLFGGDGFFMARLTGPGRIWLQTLTMPNLAHALAPYMGVETATEAAEAGGVAGAASLIGRMFE